MIEKEKEERMMKEGEEQWEQEKFEIYYDTMGGSPGEGAKIYTGTIEEVMLYGLDRVPEAKHLTFYEIKKMIELRKEISDFFNMVNHTEPK